MAESSHRPAKPSGTDPSPFDKSIFPTDAELTETSPVSDPAADDEGPFSIFPTEFGRYLVLRELGRGQMGAVYLAHDTALERSVALKVARSTTSGSVKLLKRMEIEAKSAAKIDHPLICKVYDAGEIDGIQFIALQYVQGEDLEAYMLRMGRKRPAEEALRLMIQILQALQTAHDNGIIHRDLKPENVMLNQNGEPVIMDFGLARTIVGSSDAGITQGMILGTAAYMSPEQAVGDAELIDHRTDLYSLGVMLFEMLAGEWPFTGGAIEVMGKKCVQEPPTPLSFDPQIDPNLAAICHKMIARQKEDRYRTCAEAMEALEPILRELPPSATEPVQAEPSSPSTFSPSDNFRRSNQPTLVTAALAPVPPSSPGITGRPSTIQEANGEIGPHHTWGWAADWWQGPATGRRWLGAAMLFLTALLAAFWLLPDSSGVVMIILDNPSLSVRFLGTTITEENDGEPIRVSSSASNRLEVSQNGNPVEAANTLVELSQGERRRFKISLVDGQRIEIVSHSSLKEGSDADDPRRVIPLLQLQSTTTGMELTLIPAGHFDMGSTSSEIGHQPNEEPLQHVEITDAFYLSRFEVTQEEYRNVTGKNPSFFAATGSGRTRVAGQDTHRFPVEQVSWFEAIEFCNQLSERERLMPYYRLSNLSRNREILESASVEILGGDGYRLPTEAEWEYACRAGTSSPFNYGNSSNGTLANINGRVPYGTLEAGPDLQRTCPVGTYQKNGFGLFDMHGNVAEWCEDAYRAPASSFGEPAAENSDLKSDGGLRVTRGGSWISDSTQARSARRVGVPPLEASEFVGIRVARSLKPARPQ